MATIGASARATTFGFSISYQGELKDAGTPIDGSADLVFKLFDAPASGTQLEPTLQMNDDAVTDGGLQGRSRLHERRDPARDL